MSFKPYEQDSGMLFPPRLGDLIPEGHLVRVVSEVVDRLDISAIEAVYSPAGQRAYHPRMMLKLLFYGYATGIRSSRAIAKAIEEVLPFMWLGGGYRPDFRTISDFRKNHIEKIQELFVQIVRVCTEMGMVKVGHWAIDGTKVKANAGKKSLACRETIEKELDGLRAEIEQALDEAEKIDYAEDALRGADIEGDKLPKKIRKKRERTKRLEKALEKLRGKSSAKKASRSDPDAHLMKRAGGGFEPSYNLQATVDADSQVIVANDVSECGADYAQLLPQLDQATANVKEKPEEISADAGYTGIPNLKGLEEREVEAFVPQNENLEKKNKISDEDRKGNDKRFDRSDFEYDSEADCYRCPAGKELRRSGRKKKEKVTGTYYVTVYKRTGCQECPLACRCLKGKAGYRSVNRPEDEELVRAMNERLGSERGRTAYAKRKQTVEPVFGTAKTVMRFREFLLRGLKKAHGEWSLACTAFNIRKIWGFEKARH